MFMLKITATYFDSFGVAHIHNEIKKCIGNNKNITNIIGTQADDLIIFVLHLLISWLRVKF